MRPQLMLAVVVAATVVLAPPARATADPHAPGPYAVTVTDFDAGLSTYPEATARVRGTLYVPSAPGPRPVVVFAHGMYAGCRAGEQELIIWPCPAAAGLVEDVPSWRGFDYVTSYLASHGYLVASVGTSNAQEPLLGMTVDIVERIKLVRRMLDLLAEWNRGARPAGNGLGGGDGVGATLTGRVDSSRIALVGHSRGADAVTAVVSSDRMRAEGPRYPGIRAVFSIAPTGAALVTDVHFAMLLGSCDGDTGMYGASRWDESRFGADNAAYARTLFKLNGANHRFFNSEWRDENQPAAHEPVNHLLIDDVPRNVCDAQREPTSRRLSAGDQQAVTGLLIGSFVRYHLGGDRTARHLVTGSRPLPAEACPAETYGLGTPPPCGEVLQTTYHGPAASRRLLLLPARGAASGVPDVTVTADGFEQVLTCSVAPLFGTPSPDVPRCPERNLSAVDQLYLRWRAPGTVTLALAPGARDLRAFGTLTLRAAIDPADAANPPGAQDLDVTLVDAAGGRATVRLSERSNALIRPLGGARSDGSVQYQLLLLGGARLPMEDFAGVDLGAVAEVRLSTVTPSGALTIADVQLQEA